MRLCKAAEPHGQWLFLTLGSSALPVSALQRVPRLCETEETHLQGLGELVSVPPLALLKSAIFGLSKIEMCAHIRIHN